MEKINRSFGEWVTRWLVFAASSYCLTLLTFAFAPHGLPRILLASEIGEEIRFIYGISLLLIAVGTVALFVAGETLPMKVFSSIVFVIALIGLPAVFVRTAY